MFTLNPLVCPKVIPGEILPFCHPPAVCHRGIPWHHPCVMDDRLSLSDLKQPW